MVWIAVAAAVIAVVASAVSTYVQIEQANRQAEQIKDEQEALAAQKKLEAEAARESAAFEERQQRRRTAILIGKQSAVYAAAGVDLTRGTPFFMEMDLVREAELDALNVRRTGRLSASASEFEARIAKYRRDSARGATSLHYIAGGLNAAAAGVGAYTSVTSRMSSVRRT